MCEPSQPTAIGHSTRKVGHLLWRRQLLDIVDGVIEPSYTQMRQKSTRKPSCVRRRVFFRGPCFGRG